MRLFRAADANLARDSMHVHASATAAHVGPKRMLALFLDDDRNVGANLARNRFRREMEIRRSRDAELYGPGCRFQFPVAVRARVSLHGNPSRGGTGFHVLCRALNLDFAAGSIRFDTASRIGYANEARKGVHTHIAPSVRDRHTSRSGRYAYIIAYIRGRHRPAGGGKLDVALDFFDTDGPRSGLHFNGAAHAANRLRAGRDGGADFRVARHLDRVSDADVAHARHFLADANGVASLLDGRIREGIVHALLRIVKAESRCAHFTAHLHFAVGAARDVHVTRGVGQFQAEWTANVIVAIEGAANRRPAVAAGQDNDGRK